MSHQRASRAVAGRDAAIPLETIDTPGGGTRVLALLDPHDARAYEAAVAAVTPTVERALGAGVMANRARAAGGRVELEAWRPARRRYARALRAATSGSSSVSFVGDVRDCYGSITPAAVEGALRDIGAREHEAGAIGEILRGFDVRGVRGLPIGPTASAILANAVLASVDAALAEAAAGPIVRWVDDVIAVTRDARAARASAQAFERALGALGLTPQHGKCRIVEDPAALGALARGSSAIDGHGRGMMRAP